MERSVGMALDAGASAPQLPAPMGSDLRLLRSEARGPDAGGPLPGPFKQTAPWQGRRLRTRASKGWQSVLNAGQRFGQRELQWDRWPAHCCWRHMAAAAGSHGALPRPKGSEPQAARQLVLLAFCRAVAQVSALASPPRQDLLLRSPGGTRLAPPSGGWARGIRKPPVRNRGTNARPLEPLSWQPCCKV